MSLTLNGILASAKKPGLQAAGFMLGILAQKGLNKMLGSETVSGLLGSETVTDLKKYLSPLIVAVVSVGASSRTSNGDYKDVLNGAAVSGATNICMELFWKKNLLSGLNGGILGDLLGGDDDLDAELVGDIDIEGIGDIESYAQVPQADTTIAALDIPSAEPPLRDTSFELEHISGFNGGIL